jgi:small-conductance mechanosensitive channel
MKRILFFALLLLLLSCNDRSVINKQLAGSDSLLIHFNAPQTDSIVKTVTTTEKNAINKIVRFMDSKTSQLLKCRFDGNLMFYENGELKGDISFNYSGEGCRHFIYGVRDSLVATNMSNEAANFLKSLAEDKDWY